MAATSARIWATRASTESKRCSSRNRWAKDTRGRLPVEVAVEVQEVGLDQHRGRARLVEGGTAPDRDGGPVHRAVGPPEVPGVDGVGGQGDVVGDGHVGGREPQFGAAPAVAPDDGAAHLVRAAEQAGRLLHVALRRAAPGCGWRTPRSRPSPVRPTPTTSKPYPAPSRRRSSTLPWRPCPKWKSSPTTTSRADSSSTRTSLTKSSADSFARASSKGTHERAVDAAVGQQLELLLEARQLLGGRLGAHDGGRVAVERHHHGGEAGRLRPLARGRAGARGARGGHRRRPRS